MDPKDFSTLPFRNNVASVVFKNGKFLVVQKPDWPEDFWKFPQGGVNEGETDEEAAMRELTEELGTEKYRIVAKSGVVNQYDWSNDAVEKAGFRWRGQNQKFFLVEFLGEEADLKIDEKEIGKYRWVTKKALFPLIDHDHKNFTGYKDAIEKVLNKFQDRLN